MNTKLLIGRRNKLAKGLDIAEIVIIFASSMPDYPRYFLQDNNFLYFTGLDIPDAVVIFKKLKNKIYSELFIERGIPEREVWEGKKLSREKAKEISGIDSISYLDEFERKINLHLNGSKKCFVNTNSGDISEPLNKKQVFVQKVRERFSHILFADISGLIRPCRTIKEKWEISQIQKAIDITGDGIKSIIEKAKPGMMEYELEAILQYEITRNGLRHMGFKPIIAAGGNAATLHYEANNSRIGKDEMVLLDVGAACNNYSADISRTFPVSGKFTKRQKAVYQEVLNVNKAIIKMVKPGVSLPDLNKKTVELISDALVRLKLIKDKKDYQKYFMHNVSHHLGMDTHDVGGRDSVLKAGNVITVEPGIYIPEEKIGVRIEDDILVTKDGYKNLSKKIPKEIEKLEI